MEHAAGVDGLRRAARIGAHQPASAQQRTAEIARRHNDAVHKARVADGLQRGQAGGLGRLPVVGITHARAVPQNVCVDIVVGRTVLCPYPVQKSQRLFLCVRKGRVGDKFRFFLLDARLRRALYRLICFHHPPPPAAAGALARPAGFSV